MNIIHIKGFLKFGICHITVQRGRQRLVNIVVILQIVISMNCREKHYQENDQPYFIMLCNKKQMPYQSLEAAAYVLFFQWLRQK